MEGLSNVVFFLVVVAVAQISHLGLDGNPDLTAQLSSIATYLDTHTPDAYCNTS